MAGAALSDFLNRLRRVAVPRSGGEVLDPDLLERFVADHDEAAFTALVQRHGPMVLGVCRHLLLDPHDAEDVFQATFLVLVRKAAAIQKRAQVASWLYGVAYRRALRARRNSARRRAHETQGLEMIAAQPPADESSPELRPLLHEEVNRLPEKYRAPVVLCYLQARPTKKPAGSSPGRSARSRAG